MNHRSTHIVPIARTVRFIVLALLCSCGPIHSFGAEAEALEKTALSAEARYDSKTALRLFLELDKLRPNDASVLQKISRQYSDLTVEATNVAEKKRLCGEALGYAQRAVELEPKSAVNVLSLAICYGKLASYADTRTKIEYSKLVKLYADKALQLKPEYDYAHHVLGRWNYEIATLGAATRFLAKLIYGALPPASTAEAVRHLRRAVELSPTLPSHRVELGFALLADHQPDEAAHTWRMALAMPKREKYDDEAFSRARAALAELK
jgi:Flp pilus assembly protein TadD